MSSILDTLTQQLGGDAVQQISSQLGADPSSTQQAIGAALPLLLSAVGKQAANPNTANGLLNALQQHDGSVLQDVSGYVAGGGDVQDGNGILGHLLGGQTNTAANSLGAATGLTANSSGQLLAMLAPLVMGAVGQAQQQQRLDAGSLAGLLSGHQQQADSLLGGIASQLLDSNHDGSIVDDVMKIGSNLLGGLFGKQ
ncbi:MAG: DUF937 domain-containing protein [Caldilineaceae bacterium]